MKINDILKEAVLQKTASVPQPGSPELSAWSAAKKQPDAQPQPQPGANAFGQMAQQLGNQPSTSSTGGTTTGSNGTVKHTASPSNPNQPQQPAQAQQQAQPEAPAQQLAHGTPGMPMGRINSPSGTPITFRLNGGRYEMQDPEDGTWSVVEDPQEKLMAQQAIKGAQVQAAQQRQPEAPAQQQQQAPAAPAQQKITVGQINKTIPTLRNRDLQSVKKTVDTTLGQKAPAQAQQQQQEPAQAQQQQQEPEQAQAAPATQSQPAQAQQQGGQFTDQYGDLDPTKLTPDQIRGYEFVNGKLVKKNPGFLTNLGRVAKGIFQKNTGGTQDYRADWNQDVRNQTPDFGHETMKKAGQMKAANNAQQPAAMTPQSASGIAKGMRNAQQPPADNKIEPTMEPQQPAAPKAKAKAQPKAQQPAQQQQQPGWISTPDGAQVSPAADGHPTLGKYNKQLYSLNDKDQWIDQKGKPATTAIATVLNKALEQT